MFSRPARRAGVPRLHVHLLRQTFATRYLLNGGDAFSLQRILGHTTLEMTRRYVDMVALERTVKHQRLSAMDWVLWDTRVGLARGGGARRGDLTLGPHPQQAPETAIRGHGGAVREKARWRGPR